MLLDPAQLSASGRPVLVLGEVELLLVSQVDLQFDGTGGPPGQLKVKHEDGYAVLTTHRLLWLDAAKAPAAGASCSLPLSAVQHVHSKASHIFGTPKVRVHVYVDQGKKPVAGGGANTMQLKMATRDPGPLAQAASKAVTQRAWERAAAAGQHKRAGAAPQAQPSPSHRPEPATEAVPAGVDRAQLQQLTAMGFPYWRIVRGLLATQNAGADQAIAWILEHQADPGIDAPMELQQQQQQRPGGSFSTTTAGIAGILRREERVAAATDQTMEQAFRDLRALMGKAQDMVTLAERFRGKSAAGGGGTDRTASGEEVMDADMENELIALGVASPVTKTTAGALYHQQLSRQLADFLGVRMSANAGIMALPDVFCLFNRARGTELVSPDDLLAAVQLFRSIRAPLELRTLSSNVLVVQSDSHSATEVCRRLAFMVDGPGLGPALTANDVASALTIPVAIAAEHLLTAENAAVLCRDDTPEGLRFFRNFFRDENAVIY